MSELTTTWPPVRRGPFWKTPRAAAKAERHQRRRDRVDAEKANKEKVRRRDKRHCRFPLCECRRIGLRLEVSHDRHKGQGGDPTGKRSKPEGMILLCWHRHQDSVISRHKQTLRVRYLTPKKNNGPVAFDVKREKLPADLRDAWMFNLSGRGWVEVARERSVQVLEPLEAWQQAVLERLAEMEL